MMKETVDFFRKLDVLFASEQDWTQRISHERRIDGGMRYCLTGGVEYLILLELAAEGKCSERAILNRHTAYYFSVLEEAILAVDLGAQNLFAGRQYRFGRLYSWNDASDRQFKDVKAVIAHAIQHEVKGHL